VAVAVSLGFHVLFVLALLPHAQSGLSTGGSNGTTVGASDGDGYAIDLYAVEHPAASAQLKPPTPEDLADDQLSEVKPVLDAQSVVAVAANSPADLPQITALNPAPPDIAEATAQLQTPAASGGVGQDGTTAGQGDDLWAAIAPCWKRIAGKDTLAVTLEVTFSGDGRLSKPPVIDRNASAIIDTQSLRSEAKAIDALAQCGAYQMAADKEGVKVNFPDRKSWRDA